jgi:hypothetical protein
MLASDNSDLKSIGFEEKKKVYAKSPYKLTSEIAEVDTWNPEAVETRQKTLAGLAVKAWPLK